jgi:hypothetical protein
MPHSFSRRDFLKLGGLSLASLAFGRFTPDSLLGATDLTIFDDSDLIRVAGAPKTISINIVPSFKSAIYRWCDRDELIHVYEEVVTDEPKYNPVWYRVWGGYIHRDRVQRVRFAYNQPIDSIPEGTRLLAEVTVPFVQVWRYTKYSNWTKLGFLLYSESVHWIEAVEDGPAVPWYQGPWYRIFDELIGYPYHVPAIGLRVIPPEELDPISPEVPWDQKHIDVNLTTQTLNAFESGKNVFQTNISSGLPGPTSTSVGKFNIDPKTPSKHMGNGDLFAGIDGYELPGVPWTSFFTGDGQAFHGTYWHENFGAPMSHGCINMRTSEAKWLFRWARPISKYDAVNTPGLGTSVEVHY